MRRPFFSRFLILLLILTLIGGCLPAVNNTSQQPKAETFTAVPSAEALPELALLTPEPEKTENSEAPSPNGNTTPAPTEAPTDTPAPTATPVSIDEHGTYTSRDDVALYIHLYGHLPENFISKTKARKLGWTGGSLEPYAPGKCIGGGEYLNLEHLLPEAPGRIYHECDIDTLGARSRGAKRIVWSNDGLIYYTDDHYESFTPLYGEE